MTGGVALQDLKDDIEVEIVDRLVNREQLDDVRMVLHLLKKTDLPKSALRVRRVAESPEYLLHSNRLMRHFVHHFPDDAVRSLAEFLDHLVALQNVLINALDVVGLPGHANETELFNIC